VQAHGSGLSLALLQSYLPLPAQAQRFAAHGELAFEAHGMPAADGRWHGEVAVTSAAGGLAPKRRHAGAGAAPDLVRYDALALHAQFDGAGMRATLGAGFGGHGRVDAQAGSGWSADSALAGTVAIATDQVGWLELFSPDIVAPRGRLQGELRLAGTRAQPRLGGNAQLADFAAEVPALGLRLHDGALRLDAQPDGNTRVSGQVRSGEGVLQVEGELGWEQARRPLRLHVTGTDVLASDTPQLQAVIAPDLVVRYASGDAAISVTGTVAVPRARMALAILDTGALASGDVVVLDPVDAGATPGTPLDVDLEIVAGDDVRMEGYGLEGSMRGRLRARSRPGQEILATGALDIDGSYSAYGQRLQISRGRLLWTNDPIVDPAVDLRAERRVGGIVAGVDVSGRAGAPVATVWTDPPSTPSEAISYLALGRPLAQASRDEGQRVSAARSALAVGGTLLAAQLGSKLGLDEAGVSNSRALGGEVIGAGKYLSPRLFVGYGVSLLGSGQVVTLRYLMRKGFDIEIESSTVENRASANWRLEK
jgi:translocation and assembly module TamB